MPLKRLQNGFARNIATTLALSFSLASCSNKDQPPASNVTNSGTDASPDASAPTPDASPDTSPDTANALSLFAAGATQASVLAAVPAFATQSGLTITYTFGNAGSLRDRLLTGTSGADVAIVTPAVVTALDAQGLVHGGSRVDLAQVGGGLAVRSADPVPDISDSDKFKAALLAADEIYYADPVLATAGVAFIKICTTLGIADTCAPAPTGKGHPFPQGATAMAAMALSAAATVVGSAQISEIKATPGVVVVGEYPTAPVTLQVKTVYTAFIVEGTDDLDHAQQLLQFLSSDAFMTELASFGFEPVPAP